MWKWNEIQMSVSTRKVLWEFSNADGFIIAHGCSHAKVFESQQMGLNYLLSGLVQERFADPSL